MDFQTTEPDRFIDAFAVMRLTGLSRTTLWRLSRAGEFPKPVPLSRGRSAFLESEVLKWMRERLEARERGELTTNHLRRTR